MSKLDNLTTAQAGLFTEADLLGPEPLPDDASSQTNTHDHAVVTAPILTGDALDILGMAVFPQRALYGRVVSQHGNGVPARPENSRLFINTNAPFSALVCGVQGSGKSHSTSVLLESVLIRDERLGQLPEPLSAIVFHLDSAAGGGMVQPCEAAYLASVDRVRGGDIQAPPVTVLVLPNNLRSMRTVYAGLPGVRVEPLHFASRDISGERLLSMMKVDESTQMPLYMEAIMNILRKMNDSFDYAAFRQQLAAQKFNPGQKAMLNLRLSLLDSCLEGGTTENSINTHFRKGQLTIIDLSSPFMDGSSACGFFDIILGLFVEADIQGSGKIVVLDEAHKYLSDEGASSRLTDSLLTVIRQQRHLATRVVISTQEPTVVPEKFIDLCSFVIAHRFSSPTWLKHLLQHISASDGSSKELWDKILSLNTGHAILFSPNGLCVKFSDENCPPRVSSLGQGYLTVRSRLRVTRDGGHSLLAVQDASHSTRLGRVHATAQVQETSPWHPQTATVQPTADAPIPNLFPPSLSGTSIAHPVITVPYPSVAAPQPQQSTTASGHHSSTPISSPSRGASAPAMDARFSPLVDFMRSRAALGVGLVQVKDFGLWFKIRNAHLIPDSVRAYIRDAEAAGLVSIVNHTHVRLLPQPAHQNGLDIPEASPPPSGQGPHPLPAKYSIPALNAAAGVFSPATSAPTSAPAEAGQPIYETDIDARNAAEALTYTVSQETLPGRFTPREPPASTMPDAPFVEDSDSDADAGNEVPGGAPSSATLHASSSNATFPTKAADAAGGPSPESTLSASLTSATASGHIHFPSTTPISAHPEVHAQFIPLLDIMRSQRELGMTIVAFDDLGTLFKDQGIYLKPQNIRALTRRAVAAGLVTHAGSGRVRLPEEPVCQSAAYAVSHVPSHPSENVEEHARVNDGEDAGIEALGLTPASDSVDGSLPSLDCVIKSMVRSHRRGYTRVAYSFLCHVFVGHGVTSDLKPFSRPADLYAQLERGIEDGQLVSLIEDGESFVLLPEDSPHRVPVTRKLPGAGEGEFGRLLAHLRRRAPISWKSLKWELQSSTPDTPYGQTAVKVHHAIKRACEAGVIQVEGTRTGGNAMITLPNQEDTLET